MMQWKQMSRRERMLTNLCTRELQFARKVEVYKTSMTVQSKPKGYDEIEEDLVRSTNSIS